MKKRRRFYSQSLEIYLQIILTIILLQFHFFFSFFNWRSHSMLMKAKLQSMITSDFLLVHANKYFWFYNSYELSSKDTTHWNNKTDHWLYLFPNTSYSLSCFFLYFFPLCIGLPYAIVLIAWYISQCFTIRSFALV